jgi:oligopeptide transport system substrate-binding protein
VKIAVPEPASIDPAFTATSDAVMLSNQLFSGLTRIDPVTSLPIPDLASSWTRSTDATEFTFTMRSGIKWSDGTSITAYDVHYSILRALNPATASEYAYILFAINNAEEYNNGTVTNPNQVGVTVLNSTQVKFTLKGATAHFPAVLAMFIAHPVPASVIATWGSSWTEPEHIVTNGPYRLTEWVHNDHMTLNKNASFYDASNIQIQNISVKLTDEITAWNLFLAHQLDTVNVPQSVIGAVRTDPELSPLIHDVSAGCTYYYGFSISQPPFDELLVRKAFSAAVDRQGLIDAGLARGQLSAQTFTPPGLFGSVDGISDGVGIPYNPAQAQQWLSDAGYPNGAGLPPITLWFRPTNDQGIAEYVKQNWITNLNVTVTLQSIPTDYWIQVGNGDKQIWRGGWCADYNDAYNFLHDEVVNFHPGKWGGWSNTSYLNLIDQAAQSDDNTARQLYYKQAEEILVETDAVMIPLHFYTAPVITRAYLQRPYATQDIHIRDWKILTTAQTFKSTPVQDGWVLESTETSNIGGTLNNTGTTFNLGDDAAKKQYRGILSFNTSSLPDNAVITKVTLKVKQQTIVGGGNPVTTFQGFMVDIKKGFFGTTALQASDFQTAASKTYGPFNTVLTTGWYSINLTNGKAYVNKLSTLSGLTQIRLRFKLDDNNNTIANYLSLYSGNTLTAGNRPQLIVEYTIP